MLISNVLTLILYGSLFDLNDYLTLLLGDDYFLFPTENKKYSTDKLK